MEYSFSRICEKEEDTRQLAAEFAKTLTGNEVVVLNGNLGSGKTFFIKSVCAQLEVSNVVSPTFAIVNEYDGKFHINHFDFYRINSSTELFDIGFSDYLNNESLTFIEWGELFPEVLPKRRIEIFIEFETDNKRKFNFFKYE